MSERTGSENGERAGEQANGRRRRLLGYLAAAAALAGSGAAGAWFLSGDESDQPTPTPASTPTPAETETPSGTPTATPEEDADAGGVAVPAVVRRHAPDLYFGRLERWFPTDPRPYVVERDGRPVVDGFAALEGYTAAFEEAGGPPAPTVFYNVVEATAEIDAVQYWLYSAFDQFTANFHWHDWELLQVFVDHETWRRAGGGRRAGPRDRGLRRRCLRRPPGRGRRGCPRSRGSRQGVARRRPPGPPRPWRGRSRCC